MDKHTPKIYFAIILTLLLGLNTFSNAADNPDSDYSYTWDSGIACSGFPLKVEIWNGNNHTKELPNNHVITAGTGASLLFTNVNSGQTFALKADGSTSQVTTYPNGNYLQKCTGNNVLILYPTDSPAGPSTTLYAGEYTIYQDTATGVTTLRSANGKKTDICAALQ